MYLEYCGSIQSSRFIVQTVLAPSTAGLFSKKTADSCTPLNVRFQLKAFLTYRMYIFLIYYLYIMDFTSKEVTLYLNMKLYT